MAAVKTFLMDAAELAFKCEDGTTDYTNRREAIIKWNDFVVNAYNQYGHTVLPLVEEIYDQIADRSGMYWEDFSAGMTIKELQETYVRKSE
jgi:hypothetical protein